MKALPPQAPVFAAPAAPTMQPAAPMPAPMAPAPMPRRAPGTVEHKGKVFTHTPKRHAPSKKRGGGMKDS